MKLILLEPIYKERIWGGHKIRDVFHYPIPSNKTGEAWTISAHKEGSSLIKNGPYQGSTLRTLFQERKDLFGHTKLSEFPLLVKLIDANDDLSVQVHPDDAGAKVVGSGSNLYENQINNALVFPGLFKGAILAKAKTISSSMMESAAYAIANYVKEDLKPEYIIPRVLDLAVHKAVTLSVMEPAIKEGNVRK